MRLGHILSETGSALRRNSTMVVSIIVTMWVSLSLFGAGLLVAQQVDLLKGRWYDKVEISVFLCTPDTVGDNCAAGQGVTDTQKATIQQTLESDPNVSRIYYESKQEAYDAFLADYRDGPLKDALTVDQMQDSFRVKLVDPEQYRSVVAEVAGLPGVQNVQDLREYFDPLFHWLGIAQWSAIGTSVLLLVAAALQIGNTIRLAVFSRRREIGIMRLVGASNAYITWPFLLETLVAGLAGAGLACATLAAGASALLPGNSEVSMQTLPWIGWPEVGSAMLGLVIVAILLSIVPTLIATHRHLRT